MSSRDAITMSFSISQKRAWGQIFIFDNSYFSYWSPILQYYNKKNFTSHSQQFFHYNDYFIEIFLPKIGTTVTVCFVIGLITLLVKAVLYQLSLKHIFSYFTYVEMNSLIAYFRNYSNHVSLLYMTGKSIFTQSSLK